MTNLVSGPLTTASGQIKTLEWCCESKSTHGVWRQGKDAVAKIKQSSGNSQVFLEVADVSDLASLRALADRYSSSGLPLHVLVNSAGIMVPPPPPPLSRHRCAFPLLPFYPTQLSLLPFTSSD